MRSSPGRQKARRRASMASSEPTPRKRLAGVRGRGLCAWVLRRAQRADLRVGWWGSG